MPIAVKSPPWAGQRDRRIGAAFAVEANHKLGRQMRSVRCAAAITACQQLMPESKASAMIAAAASICPSSSNQLLQHCLASATFAVTTWRARSFTVQTPMTAHSSFTASALFLSAASSSLVSLISMICSNAPLAQLAGNAHIQPVNAVLALKISSAGNNLLLVFEDGLDHLHRGGRTEHSRRSPS